MGNGHESDSTDINEYFQNAEMDKVDEKNNTSKLNDIIKQIRSNAGLVVKHKYFQNTIIFLIIINAIMIGIGTFDVITDYPQRSDAFDAIDMVFLIIFTIELVVQLTHYGLHLFLDGWLVFDFCVVVLCWSLNDLQVIRAFRVFRALRLITRIEVLKNLVLALVSVLPRMAAILAIMCLIFYIFAVMFTVLFKNLEMTENYFGSLDVTFFTLFQMMTLEWAEVARELMAIEWWAWIPCVSFIMVSSFIVYNLVVAVVCDAIFVLHDAKDDDKSATSNSPSKIQERTQRVILLQENQVSIQKDLETLAIAIRDNGLIKVTA